MKRTAVVLGGSSEIGYAIAKSLAIEGYSVVVTSHRRKSVLDALVAEIAQKSDCFGVQVDITSRRSIESALFDCKRIYGPPNLVVNCCASLSRKALDDISDQDLDLSLRVGLMGAIVATQVFGKEMKTCDQACIVHISSTAGIRPYPISHDYIAAKGGLIAVIPALALSLAPYVRVNSIAPGYVETSNHVVNLSEPGASDVHSPELTSFTDISSSVVFLARTMSITGQTIVVDNGISILPSSNHGAR